MKNIWSGEAFLDFARSKDPNEKYNYDCPFRCAGAQYAEYVGSENRNPWQRFVEKMPNRFFDPCRERPHTFGALADRIEATLELREAEREAERELELA